MNKSLLIALGGISVVAAIVIISITLNIDLDTRDSQNIELTRDISIGTLLPLTGVLSSQGESDKVAIDMAVSDFNDYLLKSNVTNWRLNVVHEDSATSPVVALEKLTALNAKNIHLVVGPASSGELRNIMGYVNSNNMLVFSQSSTAPSLAIPGDNVFRLTPDDSKQGPALSKLIQHNGVDVIIQLVRADAWGDGLSNSIEESYLENPEHISQIIRYNPESPEYSVTVSLLAKNIQEYADEYGVNKVGVVIIGFAETLQFLQSATEHDILDDVRWFGTDGITNDDKITKDPLALEFAETVHFTSTFSAVIDNDIRKNIEERLVSELGRTPKAYAYSAFDIVWIFGLAIEKSNSSDVDKILLLIPEIAANYSGAVGSTKLNAAGDLDTSNYDVLGINNGTWGIIGHYDSKTDSILELDALLE